MHITAIIGAEILRRLFYQETGKSVKRKEARMPYTGQRICGKIGYCVYDVAQAVNMVRGAGTSRTGFRSCLLEEKYADRIKK